MVSHKKKTYKIRYNSRYNTLGRKIQIYLLIFQLGFVAFGVLIYFLNKNGITKKFLDLVLLPINEDSNTNNTDNTNNTNNTVNTVDPFQDVVEVKVDVSENIYDPRYFSNPEDAFLSPVTDQDLCGTCNFFANRSQLSDNINKKNKLYKYTKDCSKDENVLISAQDLIDKYLYIYEDNNTLETYCGEDKGSYADKLQNIIKKSIEPHYLIEDSCNPYQLPKIQATIETLKNELGELEALRILVEEQKTTAAQTGAQIESELPTIEELDIQIATINAQLKSAIQKKNILIGLIVVSSLLLIVFSYYTSNFTDNNVIKTIIMYLNILLSLTFIGLSVILISNKLRTKINDLLYENGAALKNIYINFFLACFIGISSLNISNTLYNLYNYFYYKYKYSKHEHIFTIIIMLVSVFLIYFIDTNRRTVNQKYKAKHNVLNINAGISKDDTNSLNIDDISFENYKDKKQLCSFACKNIDENKRQFKYTKLYTFDDAKYKNLSTSKFKESIKQLLKQHGGFVSGINLYNKDYFMDQTTSILSNPYYYIPSLTDSNTIGGHAMNVVGWINLTKALIYDTNGDIKNEYKNYTTLINQLFTKSVNQFESDKEGEYWIVKNSWGIDQGEKGYLYIRMYDGDKAKINNNFIENEFYVWDAEIVK